MWRDMWRGRHGHDRFRDTAKGEPADRAYLALDLPFVERWFRPVPLFSGDIVCDVAVRAARAWRLCATVPHLRVHIVSRADISDVDYKALGTTQTDAALKTAPLDDASR